MAQGDVKAYDMFVGGEWVGAQGGQRFESINPYTGAPWATLPLAQAGDVDHAVRAAESAFQTWRRTSGRERANLLLRLADLIAENAEELAQTETRDNGKLIREMGGQVRSLPDYYRYWAGWADKIQGTVAPLNRSDMFHYIAREPIGVIAAIVPWNSPLLLLTWKLAPALATGNTMVIKPAEQTSASALELCRLVQRAGIPAGVVNVVTGYGEPTGAALVAHPGVAKIAFTGGDQTARRVAVAAAQNLVPLSLELGGKSPNIVFADADLDDAVNGVLGGIFGASGQTCIAGSRLLVEESIAHSFVARLVERAGQIRLGDPADPETDMGPVCFKAQFDKIDALVTAAVGEGAHVAYGGNAPAPSPRTGGGYFYLPTILTDVDNASTIARQEVFGPVLAVMTFGDEAEALRLANDSPYGLAAGVWTQNLGRAHRMASALECGIVWINTYRAASYAAPWGGLKRSGYGRESSVEAIHEFTQPKSVWIQMSGRIADPFVVH